MALKPPNSLMPTDDAMDLSTKSQIKKKNPDEKCLKYFERQFLQQTFVLFDNVWWRIACRVLYRVWISTFLL